MKKKEKRAASVKNWLAFIDIVGIRDKSLHSAVPSLRPIQVQSHYEVTRQRDGMEHSSPPPHGFGL